MVLRPRARKTRAWSSAIIIIIIIIIIVISFWGLIHLGFQRHPGNKPQYYVASCLIVSHTTTRPFFYIQRCNLVIPSHIKFHSAPRFCMSFNETLTAFFTLHLQDPILCLSNNSTMERGTLIPCSLSVCQTCLAMLPDPTKRLLILNRTVLMS